MDDWKNELISKYVSSGQASLHGGSREALLSPRAPYLRAIIKRHFPSDRRAKILDLGCGYGAFLHFLNEVGYQEVLGVDASLEQVKLAKEMGIEGVRHGDLLASLREQETGSMDIILMFDVLEHMQKSTILVVLKEVWRVLADHGIALIHVPNAESPYGMRVRYGDLTHELAFTSRSARQVFLAAGFSRVSCHEDRPVVHGPLSLVRRLIWEALSLGQRLWLLAETGSPGAILSQNMVVLAER